MKNQISVHVKKKVRKATADLPMKEKRAVRKEVRKESRALKKDIRHVKRDVKQEKRALKSEVKDKAKECFNEATADMSRHEKKEMGEEKNTKNENKKGIKKLRIKRNKYMVTKSPP